MKRLLATLLVLGCLGAPAHAETVDLLGVLQLAQDDDPEIAAAKAAERAATEETSVSRAALLPFLGLHAEAFHDTDDVTYKSGSNPSGQESSNSRLGQVTLTQPVYHKDLWAARKMGKLNAQIAGLNYRAAHQDLLLRVAQAYFGILEAEATLAAAKARTAAVEQALAQARKAFEVGTSSVNEALDAEAQRDLAASAETAAQARLEEAQAVLISLTGREELTLWRFADDFAPAPVPETLAEWEQRAEAHALEVGVAEKRETVAEQAVEQARGTSYPKLDVQAIYATQTNTGNRAGSSSESQDQRVGLVLNMPLFSSGGASARLRSTRAQVEQASHALEAARRQARLAARTAYLETRAATIQVKALSLAVLSANKAREAARKGYEVGLRTIVEVLDAEQRLFDAESSLAGARSNAALARLKLKAAVGDLTQADMETANRWLAPPANTPRMN